MKEMHKGKMVFWRGLKLAEEKKKKKKEREREAEVKREQERYTYLNVEFWRIARADKKSFLIDQCQEIKVNNRMK